MPKNFSHLSRWAHKLIKFRQGKMGEKGEKGRQRDGHKQIQSERQTQFPSICENVHEKRNYQRERRVGEGETGRRRGGRWSRRRSVSYSCWNEIPLKRPVAAAKGSWIGRWDAVISIINSSGSIMNWAEEQPQLPLLGTAQAALAAQADTNIKHIIIQWIIRCNQSALKHHKSKPAEPKQSGRLDKGQHRLSTQWASSTALSPPSALRHP